MKYFLFSLFLVMLNAAAGTHSDSVCMDRALRAARAVCDLYAASSDSTSCVKSRSPRKTSDVVTETGTGDSKDFNSVSEHFYSVFLSADKVCPRSISVRKNAVSFVCGQLSFAPRLL